MGSSRKKVAASSERRPFRRSAVSLTGFVQCIELEGATAMLRVTSPEGSGLLLFEIQEGDERVSREMRPGERVHISPKTVHRMTAIEDSDIFEVSTPELHDVVRLEDRYGRLDNK